MCGAKPARAMQPIRYEPPALAGGGGGGGCGIGGVARIWSKKARDVDTSLAFSLTRGVGNAHPAAW